jgi:hypothetical protein
MWTFSKVCRENPRFIKIFTGIRVTLQEDLYTFPVISRSVLRMKLFQKSSRENQNTFSVQYFFLKVVLFMRMWKSMVLPGRPRITLCMLDNKGYGKNNTYGLSMARMVTRMRWSFIYTYIACRVMYTKLIQGCDLLGLVALRSALKMGK